MRIIELGRLQLSRWAVLSMMGCPFDIAIRLRQTTNKWEITHENTLHSHGPTPLSTQHIHRTQELLAKASIIDHYIRQGYTTRQVLTGLREEDSSYALIPRDIYNRRKKLSTEFLAGRTPIQALLMELPKDNDWIFRHKLDYEGHLTALFCIHRTSLEMLRRHPWVILMDCTYKTNRYGLPLLDIVGLVSTGQTCYIAFAFIQDEKQDTYEVVLHCLAEAYESLSLQYPRTILIDKERALINAINVVFPDTKTIICIWHIEMNLLKKARPLLSDQIAIARRDGFPLPTGLDLDLDPDDPTRSNRPKTKDQLQEELRKLVDKGWKKMLQRWNQVVYADSETLLNQRWDWFKESYADPVFQPLLAYLQAEWLDDCPEQFLRLYTAHYLHLGETATSRAEAAHWLLKKDLHTSANDLLVVLTTFERVINRQYTNIRHTIASEQKGKTNQLSNQTAAADRKKPPVSHVSTLSSNTKTHTKASNLSFPISNGIYTHSVRRHLSTLYS
ncbi:uncharacterized protein N7498_008998 [Penicillium cinerascens]|uniref:MULE transposase domain-containing protein n=1 Tax=Penicillium cinerascens TaxID=70096 RepID=A0A9W9JES6_9EURO|nr:uncharacterized protein N7498_008998 [Penicillium cinerascens]KAJ5195560.1 hypothetical protein N7498_008998 [Penicillium cinerascens]